MSSTSTSQLSSPIRGTFGIGWFPPPTTTPTLTPTLTPTPTPTPTVTPTPTITPAKQTDQYLEVFTIDGKSNVACIEISGKYYANLGYFPTSEFVDDFLPNYIFDSPLGEQTSHDIAISPLDSSNSSLNYLYDNCCPVPPGPPPSPPSPPSPPPPLPPAPPGGGGGACAEAISNQGDVHYSTTTSHGAGIEGLVFIDENYSTADSHWVIEWLEINRSNQVSAILARRSSSNLFINTSVNSAVRIIGNPIGIRHSSYGSSAKLLTFSFKSNMITGLNESSNSLKYIGGMTVEFLRHIVRGDAGVGEFSSTGIGRNISFVGDERFRLLENGVDFSPVAANFNRTDIVVNLQTLNSGLNRVVDRLTGLNVSGYSFEYDGNSNVGNKTYPMLLNNVEAYNLFKKYADVIGSNSPSNSNPFKNSPILFDENFNCEKITFQDLTLGKTYSIEADPCTSSQPGNGGSSFKKNNFYAIGTGTGMAVYPNYIEQRHAHLESNFQPASFACKECVDADFAPALGGCGWMSALKVEMQLGGIQIGPSNDCRCCGPKSEFYYWDSSSFCGRNNSFCVPAVVKINDQQIGYDNYGLGGTKVVPFFTNTDDDIDGLPLTVGLFTGKFVMNGKITDGRFHVLKKDYLLSNSTYPYQSNGLECFDINDGTGKAFFCNNAFRGSLPDAKIWNPL